MKHWILTMLLMSSIALSAQKKLIPVASSPLTGISLPQGSKQDTRGLVVASARILLEYESKKNNSTIGETEVLTLLPQNKSGYSADSLTKALNGQGWQIYPSESDPKYAWLQKDNIFVMAYFSTNATSTDLYFGKATTAPALPGAVMNEPVAGANPDTAATIISNPGNNTPDNPVLGTWYTTSMISNNITHSYIKKQYTFNPDGSFTFYKKTFDISWSFILLSREKGTYIIKGDILTINPTSSVIEKWNKKDRADQWGNLLSSEKRKPEKTEYQFSKQYFQGIDEWDLVLKTPKQTERDGNYAANSNFPNSYMYSIPPSNDYLIEIPGENKSSEITNNPASTLPGGFTFNTTNWDDGWTSTVQEDWVEVKKGVIRVLLHYQKDESVFPSTSSERIAPAWDLYVAPRYSNLRNFTTARVNGCYPICYIGCGTVTENVSNKDLFVVLFQQNGNWTEVISPDKATFIDQFKFDPASINTWSDAGPLKSVDHLRNYNKFAISLTDITGNWIGGDFGAMNYYNAYNGSYAGMSAVAMSDAFSFSANGTYTSTHKGASGMVGNMKTYQQEYKGKVTASDWEISLTNRWQGKTDTYYAYYEAVKGGRVLHLQDKKASSMWYHLIKKPV